MICCEDQNFPILANRFLSETKACGHIASIAHIIDYNQIAAINGHLSRRLIINYESYLFQTGESGFLYISSYNHDRLMAHACHNIGKQQCMLIIVLMNCNRCAHNYVL